MNPRIKKLEDDLAALSEEEAQSTTKVDILNELVSEIGWDDPERAASLATQAYELSRKISYKKGIAQGILNQAIQAYYVSDFEIALARGNEALARFKEIGDRNGEGDVLNGLGFVFWGLGDYEKALHFMHESLLIYQETGKRRREGWSLYAMGGVYENIGDFENALRYNHRSLEIFSDLEQPLGVGRAMSGIGTVYQSQGDYDRALEYQSKCLELFQEAGSRTSESRALNDLGVIHQARDNFDEALECHSKALQIRRELGNRRAETTSLLNLGRLYNQMRSPDKALEFLNQALRSAEDTTQKPKVYQAHQALSEAYELSGDIYRALEHHKAFHQMKEEVFSSENRTKIKNLQIRFEVERAEKEAEIHRLKNIELAEALERLKETQVQLVQSEKMAALGKLIAGVAHEVNTPSGVIGSSIDVSSRAIEKILYMLNLGKAKGDARENPELRRYLGILKDNNVTAAAAAERISTLVKNLKNFARLDEAERQPAVDIHESIENTLSLIEPQTGKRIEVVKVFDDIPRIECYPNQLNQLFMTLLVNAAEAIENEGVISIRTKSNEGHVHIEISDTGRGIPTERLENIFDVGFSRDGARMRMHAGLANCYAIVQKHGGEIAVESEVGKGTTFRTTLPVKLTRQSPKP
jgi:signal transduction histidine kinase